MFPVIFFLFYDWAQAAGVTLGMNISLMWFHCKRLHETLKWICSVYRLTEVQNSAKFKRPAAAGCQWGSRDESKTKCEPLLWVLVWIRNLYMWGNTFCCLWIPSQKTSDAELVFVVWKTGLLLGEPWLGPGLFSYFMNYSTLLTRKIIFKPHGFEHSAEHCFTLRDFAVRWKGWSSQRHVWGSSIVTYERALC